MVRVKAISCDVPNDFSFVFRCFISHSNSDGVMIDDDGGDDDDDDGDDDDDDDDVAGDMLI